jgi:transposase-like protein
MRAFGGLHPRCMFVGLIIDAFFWRYKMRFTEFKEKCLANDKDIISQFVNVFYNGVIICPKCKSKAYQTHKQPKSYHCGKCNHSIAVFKNTPFEKSKTEINKWLYAFYLFLNTPQKIPAVKIKNETGVTQKTAWRMLHLIKSHINTDNEKGQLFTALLEQVMNTRDGYTSSMIPIYSFVTDFSTVDIYIDYTNTCLDEYGDIIKSIRRYNDRQLYIIERFNNDWTFQVWEFEHDFSPDDALDFLKQYDSGAIAA